MPSDGETLAPAPSLIHRSFETNCRHAAIRASSRSLATLRCSRGFLLLLYDLTPACTSGRVRCAFFPASRHDLNSLGATSVRSSPTRAFTHTADTHRLAQAAMPSLRVPRATFLTTGPVSRLPRNLLRGPSTTHSSGSRLLKRPPLQWTTGALAISGRSVSFPASAFPLASCRPSFASDPDGFGLFGNSRFQRLCLNFIRRWGET